MDETKARVRVAAWLDEREGVAGFRFERLAEDIKNGNSIVPWLVAAYMLGNRASLGSEENTGLTCPIDGSPCGVTCDAEDRRSCQEHALRKQMVRDQS